MYDTLRTFKDCILDDRKSAFDSAKGQQAQPNSDTGIPPADSTPLAKSMKAKSMKDKSMTEERPRTRLGFSNERFAKSSHADGWFRHVMCEVLRYVGSIFAT